MSDLVKRAFFLDGPEGAAAYALIDVLAAGLGLMDVRPLARVLTPFFAATPAHETALLGAAFLELGGVEALCVVTGDAVLEPLLRDAGARAVLRTLAMRGPLPDPQ